MRQCITFLVLLMPERYFFIRSHVDFLIQILLPNTPTHCETFAASRTKSLMQFSVKLSNSNRCRQLSGHMLRNNDVMLSGPVLFRHGSRFRSTTCRTESYRTKILTPRSQPWSYRTAVTSCLDVSSVHCFSEKDSSYRDYDVV